MEQNKQFNVGNVVVLKSGGPDMAIKTVHTRDGEPTGSYTCQWFAGKKLEDGVFPHESLVLKSELQPVDARDISLWMQSELEKHGCLYQDDVVDYAVKSKYESLLRENADGNLAIGTKILNEFRKLNESSVVWVKPERYWRFRVPEDEDGREARG